jgi:dihydropyrimidinase
MGVVITNGLVVTPGGDAISDLRAEDGVTNAIRRQLRQADDEILDASGTYVLHGYIDPHAHMSMPFRGTVCCDDSTSGTMSAAPGGTTCIGDFCLQAPGQCLPAALETWHGKLVDAVDVGFHIAVTDLGAGEGIGNLERLPPEGVTEAKTVPAYKGAMPGSYSPIFWR